MKKNQPMIGGMFGLAEPVEAGSAPAFLKQRPLLLSNARSGIAVVLKALRPGCIWLPSYLCHTVVGAARSNGREVRFYDVGEDLQPSGDEWVDRMRRGDVLLVIDYFGFSGSIGLARRAKGVGAWVLEDASQALFSRGMHGVADFVLYSPRKFLGVPDGGVLIQLNPEPDLKGISLQRPAGEWWLKAFRASVMRRDFDRFGRDSRWFDLFHEAEADQPCGEFAMSDLARFLLTHAFDYDTIALRRRENYLALAGPLDRWALFPDLDPGVVPIGFPIRVAHRDAMRERLFEHRIYPPVHWPIPDDVPAGHQACRRLAADIMTIPCDQRYERGDMERTANIILKDGKHDRIHASGLR